MKPLDGMAQTDLFKRGSRYYFRLRIPADPISHYGKHEFKFSLGSKERAECVRKVRAELAGSKASSPMCASARHGSPTCRSGACAASPA